MARLEITKSDAHLGIVCDLCGKPAQFANVMKTKTTFGCYTCFVR